MARPSLSIDDMRSNLSGRASELLNDSIQKEIELKKSFLSILDDEAIIENSDTFADILRYALMRGLVSQKDLAERLHYANSQVGRWAAGKAVPQYVIRERVAAEMRDMLHEALGVKAGGFVATTQNDNHPQRST